MMLMDQTWAFPSRLMHRDSPKPYTGWGSGFCFIKGTFNEGHRRPILRRTLAGSIVTLVIRATTKF